MQNELREKELEYALLGMVIQYCTEDRYPEDGGGKCLCHRWMEAGEVAFAVLEIDEGTPVDELYDRADELDHELAELGWARI